MYKSLVIRSIFLGFVALAVLGIVATPQVIIADENNSKTAIKPSTLFKDGHLTICKLNPSAYEVVKSVKMVVTAYTNISALTDDSPNTTASNKQVEYGMVATNMFKFGTRVRIGDEIFVVEDRMNSRYNNKPHIDIFLPTYKEAKEFGSKIMEVQVLES